MDMFEQARDGMARLDVSEKVKASALGHLHTWLTESVFAECPCRTLKIREVRNEK
jgi:hypothetical protein